MKLKLLLTLIIATILVACSSEDLTPKRDIAFHIRGTLLGYDGKPMELSHVHINIIGKNKIRESKDIGKSGEFSIPVKSADLIELEFTGVNHFRSSVEIFNVGCNEDIQLDIKLKPYQLKKEINELKLIGNFNNYSFTENCITMKKNADGSFTATVPNKSDTLFYQVLGALEEERSINGTQQDGFVYDGGGDYRSFIVSKDSLINITFKPQMMQFPDSKVEITSKDKNLNHYFEIKSKLSDYSLEALNEYRKSGNVMNYYEFMNTRLSDLWEKENDVRTKLFIGSKYVIYAYKAKNPNQELIKSFFSRIGYNRAIWESQYFNYVPAITVIKDKKYREELIKALTEEHPSKDVRAGVLYELIGHYMAQKRNDIAMKYYNLLLKKFPDCEATKMARKEYSPDKKIVIGKILPDFSIENLDKPGTMISSADLKGKYVLIDMWATWCGPCVGEMEHLHKAYEKFKNKNFTILSISIDAKKEDVAKFRNGKWKMPWLHSFSEGVWKSKMVDFFEVTGVPKPMLIGPDGKILEMENNLRGDDLEKTLSKYIH
jgi:thiol-disulfide isomerase/thioredoxin